MVEVGGVIALVGAIVLLGLLIALHVLPTGLSPASDPVSQYALTRFGALYRWATIAAAIAGVGGLIVVAATTSGVASLVAIVLLVVFIVSRALIGFFPMDEPGRPRSRTGAVHGILAITAFGGIAAASFVVAGAFHDAGYGVLAVTSTTAGVVMVVGTVGMLVASRTRGRSVFGLAERLIYVGFIGWFVAVGVAGVLH
ncbi:DUF998 domain-containing protein [Agromyces atrinae]|uniref:DUF998 domain-containing protein n=1 Tax=Agromyces atrinae TaxID=592376 RepID=UPI001F58A45E|nr:DUF998 domain-containing protein [Agromyces atrinae]MCI2957763.1 DUF998 domain-containing protein [Agromyces atrinae]